MGDIVIPVEGLLRLLGLIYLVGALGWGTYWLLNLRDMMRQVPPRYRRPHFGLRMVADFVFLIILWPIGVPLALLASARGH